jgi:putative hydrolase
MIFGRSTRNARGSYNKSVNEDPFELPPDIAGRIPLFAELSKVLSWTGGPVNWDLARQLAIAMAATDDPGRLPPSAEGEAVEAFRLAELWLQEATGLPSLPSVPRVRVLTPSTFAEYACGALRELIDPLASRVARAIGEQPLPDADAGVLGQAMRQLAPMFLGIQSGVLIGSLSSDVLSQYDLALPVSDEGISTLVWPAVEASASSSNLDLAEARLWTALHESAHRIEFEALPTVRTSFFSLYLDYVAALQIDLSGVMERLQQLDLTNPERLQEGLGEQGVFGLVDSAETQRARDRLRNLLALLEAFAERAVAAAAVRLPSAARLAEAARLRRAADGGVKVFQQFLGLDLPSELLQRADVFTGVVLSAGGWPTMSRLWDEAENLPSSAELEDPQQWLGRIGA